MQFDRNKVEAIWVEELPVSLDCRVDHSLNILSELDWVSPSGTLRYHRSKDRADSQNIL